MFVDPGTGRLIRYKVASHSHNPQHGYLHIAVLVDPGTGGFILSLSLNHFPVSGRRATMIASNHPRPGSKLVTSYPYLQQSIFYQTRLKQLCLTCYMMILNSHTLQTWTEGDTLSILSLAFCFFFFSFSCLQNRQCDLSCTTTDTSRNIRRMNTEPEISIARSRERTHAGA